MTTKIRRVLFLLILLTLGNAPPISAQAACTGVQIRNDSDAVVDEQAICTAAAAWTERGTQVYIYATDEQPSSEDAWFAIRDEVESKWKIYDPADQTFAKGALAVEVTTDTSSPWGQDIAFGENLFGTPLDNDSVVSGLEGRLKNKVAAGDLTVAFTSALQESYTTAFPAAVPTTAAVAPSEPDVVPSQPDAVPETSSGSRSSGGLWYLLGAIGVAISGLLAGPRLILPAWRARMARRRAQQHLTELSAKIDSLLYAARTLFTGHSVEETTLWKMFLVYGGDKYPDQAEPARELTQHAMTALDEALVLKEELDHREPNKGPDDAQALIRAYETLYLTLVGTNPRILQMSEEEFRSFIDPMAGGLEPVAQAAGLVDQVRELRKEIAEQPLRAELIEVKPDEVDADGIFGYANRIKATISMLGAAQSAAPGALEAARASRSELAGGDFPAGLSPEIAFAAVDTLLAQADDATHQQRWLDVQNHATAASGLLDALATLLPQALAASTARQVAEQEWQNMIATGYRLPFLATAQQQFDALTGQFHEHVAAGEIQAAQQALQNLNTQTSETLQAAQALVTLREHNSAELQRLSSETARIERKRSTEAGPAWERLQTYPRNNWQQIAGNFDAATATLQRLFDEPGNDSDLASRIQRKNSMEQQDFAAAEQELTNAFAAARQTEAELDAIGSLLKEVQEIESGAQATLASAQAALAEATTRRDRDNPKIDASVDQQLTEAGEHLAQAGKNITQRSFIEAAAHLTQTRDLTNRAHTSADEQARTIDDAFRKLETGRTAATAIVARARQEQTALVAAAQQAPTAQMIVTAETALSEAKVHEAGVSGKEDRVLASALLAAVTGYERAQATAERALAQIAADAQAYQEKVHAAQAAIAAAITARDSARGYVGASLADRAGRNTLQQAESLIPSLPTHGATIDAYARIIEQARRAQNYAQTASREAQARIAEVEAARAAERRRREEEERRRQATAAADRRRRDAAASARRQSSRSSSSRSSSSHRSSSMGRSSSSRSSSMGSSRRR